MKKIISKRFMHRVVLGSVLFGMFFGAGNLIFPVSVGQNAGNTFTAATIGFTISGVLLPVLAVIFTATSNSENLEDLLSTFNKKYARIFTIALLLTIGPVFSLPRTATVPYEVGVRSLFPTLDHNIGLLIFSIAFFFVALLLSLKPNKIKETIGKYINPIFLTCLILFFIIFFLNTLGPVGSIEASEAYINSPTSTSFIGGYQTMDLLAALVFTYVVISVNDFDGDSSKRILIMDLVVAGLIAGLLLVSIYSILIYIGASSRNVFEIAPNGGIALGQIFNHYLGSAGTLFFAVTITLACLKTATGLIIACSDYFNQIMPRFSYIQFVYFFSLIGLVVSNVGLDIIIQFAIPVLDFIYPLAIMHVIYGLIFKNKDKIVNLSILYATMFAGVFEVIKGFPDFLAKSNLLTVITDFYTSLPLSNLGITWVNFSVIGLIIGIIISKVRRR